MLERGIGELAAQLAAQLLADGWAAGAVALTLALDDGAGNLGQLTQPVLGVLTGDRLDVDDVARFQHLRDFGRHLALHRPPGRLRPLHTVERHRADLTLLGNAAARLAGGLESDARRLVGHLQHGRHAPRRHVGQCLDLGVLDAPVTGEIDLGDGPAIALCLVEAHEAFG